MRRLFTGSWLLLMLLSLPMLAQDITIRGQVTSSDDNTPLPGVSVQVKGTTRGISTDGQGRYQVTAPAGGRLVFSFIGYQAKEVAISNQTTLNVVLSGDAQQLTEVVVTGYGTQSRKDATGSISTVKGATIAQTPIQSFEAGLAGRSPGVQITVPNGVLNNPPVFRIRGTNSISLSSYPLIVVDGIPTYTGDYSSTNAPANPLASINPNDIETMDIAKDAAATAIYGSRAANGVVFITTKRGKSGKVKVNYDGWVGFTNTYRLPNIMNASEYVAFKTQSAANNPTSTAKFVQTNDANGNPIDTRWYDYIYRQGLSQSHNVNVSGGSDNTNYYFSTGYTKQEGVIRKNDFQRINTLFNVDSKVGKLITIGGKISYSNEQNYASASSGSLGGEAFNTSGLGRVGLVLPPILAPYNNDGSYNVSGPAIGTGTNVTGTSISYPNPVPSLDLNRSNSENNHIQSNIYFQIKPVSWITLKSSFGIDYLYIDNDLFSSPITSEGNSSQGSASSIFGRYKTSLWTNTAQFDRTIGGDHNLSLLLGQEQQRRTTLSYGLNRQTLSDPAYNVIQAGWVTNNATGLGFGENYLLSGFGRLNYNYKEKYFIGTNIRQDEYSALGVKKGIFYGLSAGWEITKENFWEGAGLDRLFSSFKIRGSYGKVGNIGGIGDYTPYSTYGSGLYGGAATLNFSSVGNPNLQWETSKKTDIGFNFGLLNDRITGEVAYYKNDIDNLILNVAQSPSTGLPSSPPQNVGAMYNKGLELSLNARVINTKNFQWSTNFNITFNKNEVTALAPGLTSLQTATSGLETVSQTMPGYPLGQLWVVRTGGVDPTSGKRIFLNSAGTPVYYQFYAPSGQFNYSTTPDGRTRYVSPTGGTSITQAADAVMYGNVSPNQYGGFDNNFKYRNFDLGVLMTYQLGFNVYYGTNAGLHDQRFWNNDRDMLTKTWQKEGDTGMLYPKSVFGDNVSNGSAIPMDINVFKGDFLKLRNLTLGYTLPATLTSRAKISNLRLYVSGQNLAVITKYPGPDPEVSSNGNSTSSQGIDRNTVGNARTITIGLRAGF
ncbi:SusC/RagA family TonB-linked outer membrane protein [Fibrivirga algicola]|uniref:SusC/RagA family TonB-linked outer membrane protein n=1 Tax=Fibrivirga algicola TaxID=2950420 RepID=A0ABX0QKI2_9BACT|nr:SusC/RagA family TonB-linked outer membrane protein [Fibrivirga algicola]ARK12027.1 SusC/RagA family TonB-linked outer membrane protein [Fibrella sp. ES10-3-2-2]NID11148.1 SusC/RagA family TonB-linked outer membrane protein [Fibrivirga algicola]